jgi:hypothetical protein
MSVTRESLLGAWTLVEWRIDIDGALNPAWPFGRDATGLIVYAPSGWMSATLSERQRTPLSAASVRQADERSRARAMSEYLAYTGRWTLAGDSVVHEIAESLNPVLLGTRQVRSVSFEAGDLVLSAVESAGGGRRTHRLRWRRS